METKDKIKMVAIIAALIVLIILLTSCSNPQREEQDGAQGENQSEAAPENEENQAEEIWQPQNPERIAEIIEQEKWNEKPVCVSKKPSGIKFLFPKKEGDFNGHYVTFPYDLDWDNGLYKEFTSEKACSLAFWQNGMASVQIFTSINNAETWNVSEITLENGGIEEIFFIFFADKENGYIKVNSLLYKTEDCGKTWKKHSNMEFSASGMIALGNLILFYGEENGYPVLYGSVDDGLSFFEENLDIDKEKYAKAWPVSDAIKAIDRIAVLEIRARNADNEGEKLYFVSEDKGFSWHEYKYKPEEFPHQKLYPLAEYLTENINASMTEEKLKKSIADEAVINNFVSFAEKDYSEFYSDLSTVNYENAVWEIFGVKNAVISENTEEWEISYANIYVYYSDETCVKTVIKPLKMDGQSLGEYKFSFDVINGGEALRFAGTEKIGGKFADDPQIIYGFENGIFGHMWPIEIVGEKAYFTACTTGTEGEDSGCEIYPFDTVFELTKGNKVKISNYKFEEPDYSFLSEEGRKGFDKVIPIAAGKYFCEIYDSQKVNYRVFDAAAGEFSEEYILPNDIHGFWLGGGEYELFTYKQKGDEIAIYGLNTGKTPEYICTVKHSVFDEAGILSGTVTESGRIIVFIDYIAEIPVKGGTSAIVIFEKAEG